MIPQNFIDDFYNKQPRKPKQGKQTCPLCGWEVDYVGFTKVECSNPECLNHRAKMEIREDDWEVPVDDETKALGDITDNGAYF